MILVWLFFEVLYHGLRRMADAANACANWSAGETGRLSIRRCA